MRKRTKQAAAVVERRGPLTAWQLCGLLTRVCAASLLVFVLSSVALAEAAKTPTEFFGYALGEDARIPSWRQVLDYHEHLSATSDRVRFEIIGQSFEKRPLMLASVSSPANLARLEEIRRIQLRLADPRTIREGELDELVAKGRTVSLIFTVEPDQTGAWLSQIVFLHRLVSSDSPEIKEWLDNTVLLFMVVSNADGLQYVHEWVEKTRGTQWAGASAPGPASVNGENARDWVTFATPEVRALINVFKRWQPTVVHDVHTMGFQPRNGIRMFVPPYVGPVEPNIHPLVLQLQNDMGMAMSSRMLDRDLSGVAFHWYYDQWNPGGPTLGYFPHHHALKMLTEVSPGRMTLPAQIRPEDLQATVGALDPRIPWANYPKVWPGGEWGNKQIIQYNTVMLEAEVDHLSRNRERYLRAKYKAANETIMRQGAPYAFIVPPDQHDASAVREMLELLQFGEVEVHRATRTFTSGGVQYPAGTHVIRLDQPFGNYAKAMLERQQYPVARACATCPLELPSDTAAFSYPDSMGVRVIPVADPLRAELAKVDSFGTPGTVSGPVARGVYLLGPNQNAALKAVARLLNDRVAVSRMRAATDVHGRRWPAGTFVITASAGLDQRLTPLAKELGLEFVGAAQRPAVELVQLSLPRVGMYRPYVTGFPAWSYAPLLFPEYGLPFSFVRDGDLRQGDLDKRFDTILLPANLSPQQFLEGNKVGSYPPAMTGGIGPEGMRNLEVFVRAGGTVIGVDRAVNLLIEQWQLPMQLVSGNGMGGQPSADETRREFMVPGSYLRLEASAPSHPMLYGMPGEFLGLFSRGPIIESSDPRATTVVSYATNDLLRSGMAVGVEQLAGKGAAIDIKLGHGHVVLFSIRPELRMVVRGNYKLLFNTIYESAVRTASSPPMTRHSARE